MSMTELTMIHPVTGSSLVALLPLPEEIRFDTSYGWESIPMNTMVGSMKTLIDDYQSGAGGASAGAKLGLSYLGRMAQQTNLGGSGDVAGAYYGVAPNPKLEVLFRGVSQREFGLSFNIATKNEGDMNSKMAMINALYSLSAPEPNNAFLEWPYTAKLNLIDQGKKIVMEREVAIKNISTNITPDGTFSTFAGGTPTHIRMDISFIELKIPTRSGDSRVFG